MSVASEPVGPGSADVQVSFCAAMVDEWARCGVAHAVVCPGSRSAPLALALSLDERISVHVRLDERSAGFFALGTALASGRPAVMCTTSGTAAAELHASVVEAHLARVPMIVCTADRPPELHGVGAPQTIDQTRLYGGSVRFYAEPGVPSLQGARTWRSLGARSYAEALYGPLGPGPVHLNLAFSEPLVGDPSAVPPGREGNAPWHVVSKRSRVGEGAAPMAARLAGRRGLLVAGGGTVSHAAGATASAGSVGSAVHGLAGVLGWPLVAEARSGCRVVPHVSVAAADGILRSDAARKALKPEVVVRLGSPWASKVVTGWLDDLAASGVSEVIVDPWWTWSDPGRQAGEIVVAQPEPWCAEIGELLAGSKCCPGGAQGAGDAHGAGGGDSSWQAAWDAAESAAQVAIDEWCSSHPEATEPGLARALSSWLPAGGTLVVSSSMPIRDVESYGASMAPGTRVLANRGANGIDGVVSTGLGVAAAATGAAAAAAAAAAAGGGVPGCAGLPVVALVGDLAFLHDSSALVRPAGEAGPPCTVVVADNDGGGIFSMLPYGALGGTRRFEQLFGTPMQPGVVGMASAAGLETWDVGTMAELGEVLRYIEEAASASAPALVRVALPSREENAALHQDLNAWIVEAVEAVFA